MQSARRPQEHPIAGDILYANGVARRVLRRESKGEWVIYHVEGYPDRIESRITIGSWRAWAREWDAITVLIGHGVEIRRG